MVTNRFNISTKFENGDVPSQSDFVEIFNSFVHKDEDKANIQMVEAGIDNERYITPALLNAGLKNIGIITGNCYMPHKETFESTFSGTTLPLEKAPIQYSVKVFKNGQLLQEGPDYTVNYNTAVITFSGEVKDRNLEINYWYKNFNSDPGNGGEAIDFTNFLHTTGNETKKGILTFDNTTPTSTSGIVLTNSGVGTTATALDISVSGTGKGIALQNSSTGTGVKVSNTGTGTGLHLNSSSASTGDPLKVTKDDIVKAKIDVDGNVTAKKFISSNGVATEFVKGDGSLDPTTYADNTKVIHNAGNEERDGALKLTHDGTPPEDVLTITKNNSANCLKLVQNSNSNATTSTFDTTTANVNRKAISIRKIDQENAFITHEGNVTATSFTSSTLRADITDGLLTIASSDSPTPSLGQAKLYAKTDGTTDMYVMGSDGVEKKIGAGGGGDLDNVLHKTGFTTETKTGELVIDSGAANVSGLKLNRITQTRDTLANVPSSSYGLISIGNAFYRTSNSLIKIENKIASTIGTTMGGTYSLCYNNNNNKIYIGGNLSRIRSMNTDGTNNVIVATFSRGNQNFYGITIASDNNIYVLEYTTGYIHRSTPEGVKTEYFANVGSDRNSALISGDNGFIYAAHDNTICKVNIVSGEVTLFATTVKTIFSLFLHSDGYIYINNLDSVSRILLDGTDLTENWVSGLISPNRSAFGICSQGGELYVSDNTTISKLIQPQKVLKTDPTGLVVKTTYLEDVPYLKASDADLSSYAKLDSPTFTGAPTAPTAAVGTNTSQIATTAFVMATIAEPTQITITTTVNITTDTVDANSKKQIGKNVIINNGVSAINITVNGGVDFSASYLKHGTGAITFVQAGGRTLVVANGTAILNGAAGSTATISSIGTTDYLRISNI